ncbi:MAG TPA: ROK family protein [Steroidobacteraceae bacterium]|nr:ROK family protein [Steroidobacteraceae bacterium]
MRTTTTQAALRVPAARVLAVEIGGTKMCIGVTDNGLPRTARDDTPNYLDHPHCSADELLRRMLERIAAAAERLEARQPDVIVVAWPGPVDEGVALRSPTILGPALDRRFDVRSAFAGRFPGATVHVMNNLTAAGYHFVGQGMTDFCIVTVASGIGNKVFLGGAPQVGRGGFGGEIGHLKLTPSPASPISMHVSELGSLASSRGTMWLDQAWDGGVLRATAVDSVDNDDFVAAFRMGERRAVRVVQAAAWPLAVALGALHLGIGLEKFLIVGGFAKALGERYRRLLARLCREVTWDVGQDWNAMVTLGRAGIDEGLAGALHFGEQHALVRLPS